MTKENIIDNIARLNSETWRDREEVRTEIGKLLSELKKALEQQPSDDCVSRQAVLDLMQLKMGGKELYKAVYVMPPVTITHGTCKDCKHWKDSDGVYRRGIGAESKCPINNSRVFEGTFYCADFEKRGNEE